MEERRGLRRLIRFPWRSRARIARDLDDEFQFHLDMRVAELRARGLAPEAARAEAHRRFGDLRDAREYCRTMDERSTAERQRRDWFAELGSDVRFAARQLRASPAFTLIATLTLALGIGATTAIFSVVNRLILNPIPYADGDRMVSLSRTNTQGTLFVTPTPRLVEAWRSGVGSLEEVATYGWREVMVGAPPDAEEIEAGELSPNVVGFLGVRPAIGRSFLPEDVKRGAPKVAVLGHGLWERRFAGARDVLGKTLTIDGEPHTIIGVMSPDFAVPFMDGGRRQLWLPLEENPNAFGAQAIAKMRAGVSRAQVDRELTDVMAALARDHPEYREWRAVANRPQDFLGSTGDTLLILLGAVAMVLLIACSNVANLLLARASTRQREFAIRAALGAGRWRLVRQLLTESLMLAVAGGALGLSVAHRALAVIVAMRPERLADLDGVRLVPLVLVVALALTIVTALLFGLAPALFAARHDIGDALKSTMRSATGHVGARRFRAALVIGEVSLSVVLLIGAGLLVRTIVAMRRAEVGFAVAGLTSAHIRLPEERYATRQSRAAVYDELLRRVRGIRGVGEATLAAGVPPRTGMTFGDLEIEGRVLEKGERVSSVWSQFAAPEYFRLMRQPLVAGRAFDNDTTHAELIINETMARQYWPGTSAVGRRLRLNAKAEWSTVVGVVKDVTVPRPGRPSLASSLQMYFPFASEFESATIIVRTGAPVPDLASQLAMEAAAVDPRIRVRDVASVESALANELTSPRFNMALLSSFAMLALVLAAVGLYGVIAYSVSQRTREMGIRLALGAGSPAVLRLILSQGVRLTIVGVVIGLSAAAVATRVMQSLLFGVGPSDPVTFVAVGVLLGLVALVASYLPARRATRVDPVVALRAD